jgi:hypothetical protein
LENNDSPGIKNTVYNQTPGRRPTDKVQNLQTLYGEDASHSGVERISGLKGQDGSPVSKHNALHMSWGADPGTALLGDQAKTQSASESRTTSRAGVIQSFKPHKVPGGAQNSLAGTYEPN